MLTFIFLGTLLLHVAMPAPLFTGLRQVALQRDMNILVYGVLQFSTSLHDLYDSTAQKLDRIQHSLGIHEQRLGVLHRQTQRAQKDQKEIRELVEGLKVREFTMVRVAGTIQATCGSSSDLGCQVVETRRSPFHQVQLAPRLHPLLMRSELPTILYSLAAVRLEQCTTLGVALPLKSIQKAQLVQSTEF